MYTSYEYTKGVLAVDGNTQWPRWSEFEPSHRQTSCGAGSQSSDKGPTGDTDAKLET